MNSIKAVLIMLCFSIVTIYGKYITDTLIIEFIMFYVAWLLGGIFALTLSSILRRS